MPTDSYHSSTVDSFDNVYQQQHNPIHAPPKSHFHSSTVDSFDNVYQQQHNPIHAPPKSQFQTPVGPGGYHAPSAHNQQYDDVRMVHGQPTVVMPPAGDGVPGGFTPLPGQYPQESQMHMGQVGAGFSELLPSPTDEDSSWGVQQSNKPVDNTDLSDAIWQRMNEGNTVHGETNMVALNARGTFGFGY